MRASFVPVLAEALVASVPAVANASSLSYSYSFSFGAGGGSTGGIFNLEKIINNLTSENTKDLSSATEAICDTLPVVCADSEALEALICDILQDLEGCDDEHEDHDEDHEGNDE